MLDVSLQIFRSTVIFWAHTVSCFSNLGVFYLHSFQGQRTVYRLTLVKGWNVEEIKAYSELVALGKPDFIEVKVIQR